MLTYSNGNKEATDSVPLVLTDSSLLPNVHESVNKHLHVLYQSERMEEVFAKPPFVAYRRDINLCDTLIHGKTNKTVPMHMMLNTRTAAYF